MTNLAYPAVTTLTVDRASGTTQHWVRNLRDPSGNGPQFDLFLDFRPSGIYLSDLRLTAGFSGVTTTEDLRPASPEPLVAAGAGPGTHLAYDLAGGSGAAHLVIDVLRTERVTVG
ncbi:MAG: hypothetical protein ABR511_04905, partial [Acidimicrobiales bacterium]